MGEHIAKGDFFDGTWKMIAGAERHKRASV
jgi:hypothetical protein